MCIFDNCVFLVTVQFEILFLSGFMKIQYFLSFFFKLCSEHTEHVIVVSGGRDIHY